jgi:hypothetical protein
MPAGPGPTGYVIPPATDTRAQAVQVYAADFAQEFGDSVGQAFIKFANGSASGLSAQKAASAFALIISQQGIAGAIKAGSGGIANFLKGSATGGANTLAGLTGGSGSDWQHLLLRISEFVVGGLLVAIGLNAMLRKSDVYQQAQKAAVGTATKVVK